MRVMCIDGVKAGTEDLISGYKATDANVIIEGETYTVVGTMVYKGVTGYALAGMPPSNFYKSSRFAPLSEIDEMELVNSQELQEA